MQKIDADITLNFPFNWEYSIDNGTSWTAVNADTDVTILATDLPTNKKIKIRSNDNNATRLGKLDDNNPRANISQEDVRFDEINIRNCGTITNLNTFLKDVISDKVIIQRTHNVENLAYMLNKSVTKFIYLGELPSVAIMDSCFEDASFGLVSPIIATETNVSARSLFKNASGNIVSRVEIKKGYSDLSGGAFYLAFPNCDIKAIGNTTLTEITPNGAAYFSQLFYQSKIEKFPSTTFSFSSTTDSYSFYKAFYIDSAKASYMPLTRFSIDSSKDYNFYYTFYTDQLSNTSTKLKFMGLDFKLFELGVNTFTGMSIDVTLPSKGGYLAKANVSNIESIDNVGDNQLLLLFKNNANSDKRWYYENVDWFPIARELAWYSGFNNQLQNIKAIGYIKCQPYIYKVNGNNIEVHSSPEFSYGGVHDTSVSMSTVKEIYNNTSNVSVGIQGYTARQEGADIKIYDKDNTLLSTIGGVTFDSATFTWDGLKLYVVTGGTIDRAGNAGQTITNVVKVYEVATGNELNELTFLSTEADEYIVGCYQANDDYTLKVAKVKYHDNGGTYEFESAKVESYDLNNGNLLVDTEPVSEDFNLISQDWIEENEFWLINTINGRECRMVGK